MSDSSASSVSSKRALISNRVFFALFALHFLESFDSLISFSVLEFSSSSSFPTKKKKKLRMSLSGINSRIKTNIHKFDTLYDANKVTKTFEKLSFQQSVMVCKQ